jgi:hypothetical protein
MKRPRADTASGAILDAAKKRQARYQTNLVDRLDPDIKRPLICGSYSVTYGGKPNRRDVLLPCAIHVGEGVVETPSAIARDYLAWKYHRGPIYTAKQDIALADWHMPIACRPTLFEYGEYVDIKSAWWSILSIVGWDTDIWPEKWWRSGKPPSDFPFPDKSKARNSLVSVGLSQKIRWWRPEVGHIVVSKSFNRLYNRSLYVAIANVLSAIALQCLAVGACYWHTDGAICPSAKIAQNVDDVIHSWGLETSVKYRGKGFCSSVGHYTFTTPKERHKHWTKHTSQNICEVNIPWVWERWQGFLSARALGFGWESPLGKE